RLLQAAKFLTRLEAELLRQHFPRCLKRRQGIRLAAGAVQGAHQLGAEVLAKWMLLDELLELADELAVAADLQFGVDAVLQRRQPSLLEPTDFVARERLESEVVERRPAPQCERGTEILRALARLQPAGLGREPLEARQVEALRIDAQHISGRLRHDRFGADRLA